MARIQESSGVSFSLSFLIQVLSAIVLGVWGYSQLDSRISFLETTTSNNSMHIEKIQADMLANQDAPISSDHIQNTSIRFLETMVAQHESEIIKLQDNLYQLNRMLSLRR
tara:strand:+ start:253 stop:582 length:330 start_codon:yes stop_codon:yes gene_type:complete